MIDFDLSEDHLAVEKMVRDFAAGEVAPHIQENDAKKHFDRSILTKMAELNILGIWEQHPAFADYAGGGVEDIGSDCPVHAPIFGQESYRHLRSVTRECELGGIDRRGHFGLANAG